MTGELIPSGCPLTTAPQQTNKQISVVRKNLCSSGEISLKTNKQKTPTEQQQQKNPQLWLDVMFIKIYENSFYFGFGL